MAAAFVLAVGAGMAWTARGPLASWLPAGLALIVAVLLYAFFWLALALWVNSWRRDSAYNAVALVVAWLVLLLVLPAAINAIASVIHPAPARAEMVLAVRQAGVDAERDRAAELERFKAEHGMALPSAAGAAGDAQRRAVASLLAADRRADEVLERHEALARSQRALSDRLAWLAPPMRVNDLVAEIAGNGHTRWDAQMVRVAEFHSRWQQHFLAIAQRGERLSLATLQQRPPAISEPIPTWSAAGKGRVAATIGWLGLCCGLLAWMAARRLRRAG